MRSCPSFPAGVVTLSMARSARGARGSADGGRGQDAPHGATLSLIVRGTHSVPGENSVSRIAIVGSGIAGCVAAHGFLADGHEVTLYTDRSRDAWLEASRPTGTAARFDLALSYERALGLNAWDAVAPRGEGVFLEFCPTLHNRLVRLAGRARNPFQAVDVRLQSHHWMHLFGARGGTLALETVTPERLDAIARRYDLTLVAAGRGPLAELFAPDPARSRYREPQRQLAMMITVGGPLAVPDVPYLPVKFDFLGTDGEVFFIPYYHKDHGPSWNLLFEAKAGSRMDRFRDCSSGEDVVRVAKQVIGELFPWDAPFVRDMELADPLGWLVGAVTPVVRQPVARLPSGGFAVALGDTAISFDPIAAQGANHAVKQARFLVESVAAARGPLDARWAAHVCERFYLEQAEPAVQFTERLLEPLTRAGRELLIAQQGSDGEPGNRTGAQRIANAFFANFNDPRELTEAFGDLRLAREVIRRESGSWIKAGLRGRAAIARQQLRQRLGRAA